MLASYYLARFSIPIILVTLLGGITWLLFLDVSKTESRTLSKDRINPYVLCTAGTTIIGREEGKKISLKENSKEDLKPNDRIRTLASSTAVIFWADGSVTRLSENTNISLLELRSDPNGSTQVEISMSEGKTWSNIVRMLDPNSSFKQRFDHDQKVAAVRGTQFGVNLDKGYLYTSSHSVDIQWEKWEILTTVSEGKAVSTRDIYEIFSPESLDKVWQNFNTVWDAVLATEQIQKLQADLAAFTASKSKLEKLQDIVRSWFGLESISGTIRASVENGALSVIIDPKKLSAKDTASLVVLYEWASNISLTGSTLRAKSSIQDALVQTLPAKEAKRYQEIFARGSLYDSWETIDQNLPESTAALTSRIKNFARESGSTSTLCSIQKGLPSDRFEEILAAFKKWNLSLDMFGTCFIESVVDGAKSTTVKVTEDAKIVSDAAVKKATDAFNDFLKDTNK